MPNDKILVSFVYKENDHYSLVVPDLGNSFKVEAKNQSDILRKSIGVIRKEYRNEISSLIPTTIEEVSNTYKKKHNIPLNAFLYPLTIKAGRRVKKYKQFSSSMDESILKEIEVVTKERKIKKSDFFTHASRAYLKTLKDRQVLV